MRTRYPLLIIVAAIVLTPEVFPGPVFSQAPFYQGKGEGAGVRHNNDYDLSISCFLVRGEVWANLSFGICLLSRWAQPFRE